MKQLSFTEENYLKSIFFLSTNAHNLVSTNALAQRLQSKAATVTDMLRRLAEKDLISYTPYKGAALSERGQKAAISILRKHRLWETFLVEKLEFGWEEVHEIAEELEHIRSAQLTEKLAAFLGHPDYDPHGDPIPNAAGVFPKRANFTLNNAKAGKRFAIKGVKDNSTEFLKYIRNTGIGLGDEIKVERVESFDNSLQLKHGSKTLTLSAMAASNIYVIEL
jgi:DtxR family Mn-dependent transcriptional regulator